MISVPDAFKKFRSRLELSTKEQENAKKRGKEIREYLDEEFHILRDILTGSYKRWTKTKPLKDVDIFCILDEEERHYRDKHPSVILAVFEKSLKKKYGDDMVSCQRRSVTVAFREVKADENEQTDDKVMSFDVVPAFDKDTHYEIPDTSNPKGWTETDPEIHYDKAVAAQEAYSGEWKGIVRMAKKWNARAGKPVKPSFLIEVMALDLLVPPYGGNMRYELKNFFAAMAERIHDTWPDPAGLGPPVNDSMDAAARDKAKLALRKAEADAAAAIQLEKQNKNGDALKAWRALFGPLFPLS